MNSSVRICVCGSLLGLLGACTLIPRYEPVQKPPPTEPVPTKPSVKVPKTLPTPPLPPGKAPSSQAPAIQKPIQTHPTPAVVALLDRAKSLASQGEGEQAAATLERALRIEPRNPWLWHRLAVLRLQQGEWQQAIELATKSNTLSNDHPPLLMGNWKVIGLALEHLDDKEGASRAMAKSEEYRQRMNEIPSPSMGEGARGEGPPPSTSPLPRGREGGGVRSEEGGGE